MCDVICVTNRKLCKEDFLGRIEKIAREHPKAIILREKDLLVTMQAKQREITESSYEQLAKEVLQICKKYRVSCILHEFVDVDKKLNCDAVHLPFHSLLKLKEEDRKRFLILGASCHSLDEAIQAEKMGCTYIIVGHIFETECKKGLEPRGISFLHEICNNVSIPVYAIGGIHEKNVRKVQEAGAAGVCIMSGLMTCENPKEYFARIREQ